MKKRRIKWIGKVQYKNGFFRTGIVKNNKPKHDVIRLEWKLTEERKSGASIENHISDFAIDEAMTVNFLLSKAILIYIFQAKQDIRLWEYQDEINTLKVCQKKKKKKQ